MPGGITEINQGQLLLTEEEWRRKESNEGMVLLTREEWLKRTSKEGTRGKDGVRGVRDRSRVWCFNCQAYGHFVYECRNPHKDKDVQKEVNLSRIQDDEPALLMAGIQDKNTSTMLLKEETVIPKLRTYVGEHRESQVWYLDNGASNHMTGQRGKFTQLDESMSGQVRFGDGSTVSKKGRGVIPFKCKNGEEKLLNDVYYIPELCNNIISLGQLSEDGNKVVLDGKYLWVYDERGRLLMKVKKNQKIDCIKIVLKRHGQSV